MRSVTLGHKLAIFTFFLGLQAGAGLTSLAQQAPLVAESGHTPAVSAKLNSLAHRALATGVKANALAGDDLSPWHLKLDYKLRYGPKIYSGSVEEWHVSRYQWRRTSTGSEAWQNGSEWSVSKLERYQSKSGSDVLNLGFLNLRVSRPAIDPLYQAVNIQSDYEMEIKRVTTAGVQLNCVSVVDPSCYADQSNPDWLFPNMCFDSDFHLRITVAGDTSVQFEQIETFQNHAVARDVKVIQAGALISEAKVSVLEPMAASDTAQVAPPRNAEPQPFTIEPGFPRPEPIYEVGASISLVHPSSLPYPKTLAVPILIKKDGSVKAMHEVAFRPWLELLDAVYTAVDKWKYKPYIVDGQAVEVAMVVTYPVDMRPFVPSYDRPKPAPVVTSPEDYSSAWDPKRNPEKDLEMARAAAAAAHKRILLDVGGDWCSWCKLMDKFFADHRDVRELRDTNFVWMKVNMSVQNENAAFLGRFPAIPGYPWLFVLGAEGNLLKSENTDELEDHADGYSTASFKHFLEAWKPQ